MVPQQSVLRGGERATDLAHEQRVGIRRRPDDLDAARREVDHEERVVRHQAAPRPDLGRDEIRAGDRAPVRPQKRPP